MSLATSPDASTSQEVELPARAWTLTDTIYALGAILLLGGLCLSVLQFGGVTGLGQTVLWSGALPGSLLILAAAWREKRLLTPGLPEWLLIALIVYIFAQTIPLPAGLTSTLSPESGVWHQLLGNEGMLTLSTAPGLTFQSGLGGLLLLLIYLAARHLARWMPARWIVPFFLIGLASFDALYGIYERYFHEVPTIWGLERTSFVDCVTGTFINRNHFATLIVMAMPMALVMLWRLIIPEAEDVEIDEPTYEEYLARHKPLTRRLLQPSTIVLAGLIVVMAGAVLLSRSRMGTAALFVSMVITLAQIPWFEGLYRHQKLATGVLAALIVMLFVALLGGGLGQRFKQLAVGGEMARRETWAQTLEMTSGSMLTGLGAGTYPSVFQRYARLDDGAYAYHAHSDPLEFFAETGLIGFALMFAFAATLLGRFIQLTYRFEEFGVMQGFALAAMAGLVGVLCAMSVDFPMQIPGLLALTALLAGTLRGATQEAVREAYMMLEETPSRDEFPPLRYGPDGETMY